MRTRSRPSSKVIPADGATTSIALPPSDPDPPKIVILPESASSDARIVTLPNPATSTPNRYYFCPEKGFYEFTRIAAPKGTPRSWLLTPDRHVKKGTDARSRLNAGKGAEESYGNPETVSEPPHALSEGYVTNNADLLVATPIDALFLVLPALSPASTSKGTQKQMFLSIDDHLDNLAGPSSHMKHLLRDPRTRIMVEARMGIACDTVDAGDERMYRFSREKLLQEMLAKAKRMVAHGLPASMEEKFVRSALEVPVMNIRREDSTVSAVSAEIGEETISNQTTGSQTLSEPGGDSQESTSTTSKGTASTEATSISSMSDTASSSTAHLPVTAPEGIPHLLRLRTTLNFMLSSYLPPHLRQPLLQLLHTTNLIDFRPLDAHLDHLAALRKQAQALRSLSDNISRKRSAAEDDEAAETRAEKKRKKEEEEQRKKMESRAVKELKKVDTSGMKKLSAFFAKVPVKGKG